MPTLTTNPILHEQIPNAGVVDATQGQLVWYATYGQDLFIDLRNLKI